MGIAKVYIVYNSSHVIGWGRIDPGHSIGWGRIDPGHSIGWGRTDPGHSIGWGRIDPDPDCLYSWASLIVYTAGLVCAFNLFVCLIWGKFTLHLFTIINNGL